MGIPLGFYEGYIGVIVSLYLGYGGYIGIMENKMETAI